MQAAAGVTPDRPILIDRFLHHALECEADAICDGTHAFVPAVMEHIELAGVHSGDSACILPSLNISAENLAAIKDYTKKIAEEMHVCGLMNMQYAIEDGKVFVLEANPRASRTVPLVSKVCAIQMVQLATEVITGELTGTPSPVPSLREKQFKHYGVKEAVFPFNMFPEVDPVLGPEMRSTGEVLGLADTFGEAFYKAQEATKTGLPLEGRVLISVSDRDKPELIEVARGFYDGCLARERYMAERIAEHAGRLAATGGTADMIEDAGIPVRRLKKVFEGRPNLLDSIANGEIDLIVNTPAGKESIHDDSYIRKGAIKAKIPYMTTMAAAKATAAGILEVKRNPNKQLKSLQEIHASIS